MMGYRAMISLSVLFVMICISPVFPAVNLSSTELIKVTKSVEVKKGTAPFQSVPENLQLAGAKKRLDAGDKVKTAAQSAAEMVLKETCVLAVKEKTLFEIPAVVGQAAITKLKAQSGSFLFKVVSGSDFKVETADVVAGVKGTLFEVQIVDDIAPLIELPNLLIGVPNGGGGTTINVFEGEVELKHARTGKIRKLLPGEGLAALGDGLMKLDPSLAEGFGNLRKFKPRDLIRQNFGQVGEALADLASTRLGISRFAGEGLSLPTRFSSLRMGMRELSEGLPGNVRDGIRAFQAGRKFWGGIRGAGKTLKEAAGVPFEPSFEKGNFPRFTGSTLVGKGEVREGWLGAGCFVAVAPDARSAGVTIEPAESSGGDSGETPSEDGHTAIRLPETGGEACFRIKDYLRGIDALVTYRSDASGLTSNVSISQGSLLVRAAGEGRKTVLGQGQAFAVSTGPDGNIQPVTPSSPSLVVPELVQFKFSADSEVERQKKEHDARQKKAQGEVKQQFQEAVKNPEAAKKKVKDFGKALKGFFKR